MRTDIRVRAGITGVLLALGGGCAQHGPGSAGPVGTVRPVEMVELFPHVRVNRAERIVEFDAIVSPILVRDPSTPLVYLEVLACTPDTREHETLVVTRARPSHIHAALLTVGAVPGAPGGFRQNAGGLERIAPRGSAVQVRFLVPQSDGASSQIDPLAWVGLAPDGKRFREQPQHTHAGWVFGGSKFVTIDGREVYGADLGGNVLGLTTFGDEVLSFSEVLSPEAGVQTPEWIARLDDIAPAGSPVVVRVRAVDD